MALGDREAPPRSCGHVTSSMCYFVHSGDDKSILSGGMNCSDSGFLDDILAGVKGMSWDLGGKGKAAWRLGRKVGRLGRRW